MDIPTIRNVAWIRVIPLMLVILVAAAAFHALGLCPEWACNLLAAVIVVVGYRYLTRYTVTRHHVKGLRLVRAQRFDEATRAFEQNLAFFEKHPNLDKWRSLIFLSPARYGHREMTLMNLGYTSAMMRRGARSAQYYKRALELNPKNGAAIAALNLLNSALEHSDAQVAQ
ncbi:MAG: hypothetical protein GTN93_10325 [Anaerolineae bacterium]|nr:hypothetical protein [Anaerolineae bacterium]